MVVVKYRKIPDKTGLLKRKYRFVIASDFHILDYYDLAKAKKVIEKIKELNPYLVLLVGDLLNCKTLASSEVLDAFSLLGPTVGILGNHDRMSGVKTFIEDLDSDFENGLRSLDNFHLLDNETYEDDIFRINGITLPFSYYEGTNSYSDESFEKTLDSLLFLRRSDPNKYNILLCHCIKNVIEQEYVKKLSLINDASLIIGAHEHNGGIPVLWDKVMGGRFGLVTHPFKITYNSFSRGLKLIGDKFYLINPPVKAYDSNSRVINHLIYPPEITCLDIEPKLSLKR